MNKEDIIRQTETEIAKLQKKLDKLKGKVDYSPGGVFRSPANGEIWLQLEDGSCTPSDGYYGERQVNETDPFEYLGKFNDAFVLKRDVAEALSYEDMDGDSILNTAIIDSSAISKSREALVELGIIEELLI